MLSRIVEIADAGRALSIDKGFLVVSSTDVESTRIPLNDIGALIGNAHRQSFSKGALVALAERGVPVLLCGRNHLPTAMVWPVEQHYEQAGRIHAQAEASRPLKKRLWQAIVQRKLAEQSGVLRALGRADQTLERIAATVKSGDTGGAEAQGARYYWKALFGEAFRRNRKLDGINAQLNYGYTVLRAVVARGVVAAGLHPSLGIFHRDPQNAFQLVDDLMEPYRPRVDAVVFALSAQGETGVSKRAKRTLALAMYRDCCTPDGRTPLIRCTERTAASFAASLVSGQSSVFFPEGFRTADLYATPPQEQAQTTQ